MDDRTCAYPGCGNMSEPGVYRRLKYCGDVCRERDKWRKRKPGTREGVCRLPCVVCGEVIGPDPYKPFRGGVKHNRCFEHGTHYGYDKHGCRCEDCRAAAASECQRWKSENQDRIEAYNARRRAVSERRRIYRRNAAPACRVCGDPVLYAVLPEGKACHRRCGSRSGTRFPDDVRDVVYKRDRYRCHLCGKKVDVTLASKHPLSASLDHLVPRSQGGSDDPENLRLAHRLCNSTRRDLSVREGRAVIRDGCELSLLW